MQGTFSKVLRRKKILSPFETDTILSYSKFEGQIFFASKSNQKRILRLLNISRFVVLDSSQEYCKQSQKNFWSQFLLKDNFLALIDQFSKLNHFYRKKISFFVKKKTYPWLFYNMVQHYMLLKARFDFCSRRAGQIWFFDGPWNKQTWQVEVHIIKEP